MMVSPKFQPIKQEKISTKIAEQIKSLINKGELKPGDALPPERELVKSFNVSRASLREALNTLAGMGFLEMSQKHRTIVKSLTSGRITDPLHQLLKEDIQTVFELIEVRKAIESWSAYHAASRATADDIARLEKSVSYHVRLWARVVTSSIHFDDQTSFLAEEVHDVGAEGLLPPELRSQFPTTHELPQRLLRGG